jgi:outer membrane protein assembly factor BamB
VGRRSKGLSGARGVTIVLGAVLAAVVGFRVPAWAGQDPCEDTARQVLETADMHGGLIVHLGSGDGRLTAALHRNDRYVVQGLERDASREAQARQWLQKQGSFGPVSVRLFDGTRLPYADNLVNLIVVSGPLSVAKEELLRVLCPDGAALFLTNDQGPVTNDKLIKPRPDNIDEWTHFLHDASGNAVAHDDQVAPPGSLQWTEGPRYTRSHEHIPGIYALVSAGGRVFYILDEAPVASIRRVSEWQLLARDAFNGILLWKQPVATWYPHLVNWGQTPPQLQRRLVCAGNRVYVTLGWHAPLTALNAATGESVRVYEDTEGTEEVLWHQGILLLVIRGVTAPRLAEQEEWTRLIRRGETALDDRDTAEPLVQRLRASETKGELSIVALEAESGRVLWKRTGEDVAGLRPLSLCADADRVCFQAGQGVVCVDLKTGAEHWSAASGRLYLVRAGIVVCADNTAVTVLSAQTGERRWQQPHQLTQVHDVFVAGGSLWVGGFKPFPEKRGPSWGPYFVTQMDLDTGRVLRHIEPENPSHHHRCYPNKATDRFILGGRRGTEFIDLASGEVLWNSWARGVCRYGVLPCNGLLYVPPHACACYMSAKLIGFNVLAPQQSGGVEDSQSHKVAKSQSGKVEELKSEVDHLERGPAYDQAGAQLSTLHSRPSADWPTYRHDAERSGASTLPVPAQLRVRWQADVGGRLTAPTVADGKVFTASVDQQGVCVLDADSGQPAWHFTAGARVDSPPTVYQGRAMFGCRDGCVYSVRTSDGALAWRHRVAREDRQVMVNGQLESVSPVPGSVLVHEGLAYCTAGRSSYLDGGIDLCRLDPQTGKLASRTPIYSPDSTTGRQPPQASPATMPGAREDILSGDRGHVYLRDMAFDTDGELQASGASHLFAMTGFLDDAWAHRSYWIFGTQCSVAGGCSSRDKNLIYGRLLAFEPSTVFGYGRAGVHWSNQLQDGRYRLFAVDRAAGSARWEQPLPIQVRAMILAGQVLFVAGPPAGTNVGPWDRGEGQPSLLLAVSAADGKTLAQMELPNVPLFDGLAAAGSRLYISLENGAVACLDR